MKKFYIVTPSYNALQWLQSCVRSVADQVGESVQVHHHIQDGGSGDGTVEWLKEWQNQHAATPGYKLTFESAKDAGLYDAINIAWRKMPEDADVTAHINADEQYLEGAFEAIAVAMEEKKEVDMFITSYIVLDKDLRYICHRRPSFPNRHVSKAFIQIVTNTCFYKASSFRTRNIWFDTSYKALADVVFFRDIMATRPCILRMPELFGSTYVVTGSNVSWLDVAQSERQRIRAGLPNIVRRLLPLIIKSYSLLGMILEYFQKPLVGYKVYIGSDSQRQHFIVKKPTLRWKMRSVGQS